MELNDIKLEYIIEYCKEHNEVEWLKEVSKQTKVDKHGRERKISFIELRNLFARKFYPDLIPDPKPKKKSMYELIDEL